ncbi:CCR4-NOT transcription complex subunit 9 [Jatropha curcas]|uniref:CCR4-NOT transcription complex subunit 9 n=1 Tax=Jatropha curcas TaxID=180498 RepID=UPI0018932876|nr:CCR4-NOT transcription complex subunit 9 [Jatropha curcas]
MLQNRAVRGDLAPLLWHSFGTITTLLQEIISVYHLLSSPYLTDKASNKVCNALVLLQGIAAHPDTKMLFIKAKIPLYLTAFLNNTNKEKSHEFLRLSSLGVIGALVKVDDAQVVRFLLSSEILPSVLRCMEVGNELSKTVATFIVYRILLNDEGLKYCSVLADRFFAIGHVLAKMIEKLAEDGRIAEDQSKRLLKHIIWCYHRLSESPRACDGLRCCLPMKLRDSSFINVIRDDQTAMHCLGQLFHNVAAGHPSTTQKALQPVSPLLGHLIGG